MSGTVELKAVDRVEITTVLDNTIDLLLPSSDIARRASLGSGDWRSLSSLVAEHGFAALVRVVTSDHTETVLFDAGLSRHGLIHNLDVLGNVRPQEFHAIVLSHGHADHTRGLIGLVERLGKRRMPLILHPDAFLQRKVVLPDGHEIGLPPPDRSFLNTEGIEVIEQRAPSYLVGNTILVTGQIHRDVGFESGFPIHYAMVDDHWQPDPWIHDDQAVVLNRRGKGLVVLTGCGHAGVINTVRYAQKLTGERRIHAIIGGFHLSGPLFEPRIAPTVTALKELAPDIVIPGHCTGWAAQQAIARELSNAFVPNSVGTTFIF